MSVERVTLANLHAALQEVDAWVDAYPAETVLALWDARAWEMMQYPTWEALCDSRGWTRRVALPRPERREVVATLRQEGMSTRAIAAATGIPQSTVSDDIKQVTESGHVSEVTGTDGKTYRPTRPVAIPEPEPDEPVEVLTAHEWADRNGHQVTTDPDPTDLIPEQSRFEMRFWRHLDAARELATDLDYPHHFNEQMTRHLLDLVETLARKQDALNQRSLHVVNGGRR